MNRGKVIRRDAWRADRVAQETAYADWLAASAGALAKLNRKERSEAKRAAWAKLTTPMPPIVPHATGTRAERREQRRAAWHAMKAEVMAEIKADMEARAKAWREERAPASRSFAPDRRERRFVSVKCRSNKNSAEGRHCLR